MDYGIWLENSNSYPLHSKIGLSEYVIRLSSKVWCIRICSKISKCLKCCSNGVQKVIIWSFLIEHGGNFAWLRFATFQRVVDWNIASLGSTQTTCHSPARSYPIHSVAILTFQDDNEDILKWQETTRLLSSPYIHQSIHPSTTMINTLWIVLPFVYPTASSYGLIYQYSPFVKKNYRNIMPYQNYYSFQLLLYIINVLWLIIYFVKSFRLLLCYFWSSPLLTAIITLSLICSLYLCLTVT